MWYRIVWRILFLLIRVLIEHMYKESGDRSKVIYMKAKCRAKKITWSLAQPLPISCPLNWCCQCSIYYFPSICSPVSHEFLQNESSCFLIWPHLLHGLRLLLYSVILFPFFWGLKLHSVCLKFSWVLYCKHPSVYFMFWLGTNQAFFLSLVTGPIMRK